MKNRMKFRSSKTWVFKMTLRELKSLQKRIDHLSSKRAWLRSNAQNTTPSLSGMPSGGGDSDKLGSTVAQIADIDAEISALTAEYNAHLKRLSSDVFEEYCILLHIVRGMTWRRVAFEVTGRADTEHSIIKRCQRYSW